MIVEAIFRIRRDTAANWTSVNPVLKLGEPGLETDTRRVKYGDGTTAWTSLAYSAIGVTTISVVTANGISGSVADPTTTPAITLTLGAITPTSVAASGPVSGTTGTFTGALTYGGVTLSNSVTGTGSMVLSNSPTFTGNFIIGKLRLVDDAAFIVGANISAGSNNLAIGTTGAATVAFYANAGLAAQIDTSGRFTFYNALIYGGVTLANSVTGTGSMVLSANPSLTGTLTAQAIDVAGEMRCDSIRLDQAATAGTFTATHYLSISLNGTTYRIPCAI